MLNNNMEGDQNAEANPGPADMLTMATLRTQSRYTDKSTTKTTNKSTQVRWHW